MGRLTTDVFNPSCCDGNVPGDGDSKRLADKHYEDHKESSWVPQQKMGHSILNGVGLAALAAGVGGVGPSAPVVPGEQRIVDPLTGGEKGSKLARFDLIPNEFELALAEHYGRGARKYADRNWERGYKWGLSVAALRRHLSAWMAGERLDSETGSHHLIAVAWHAVALFVFETRGIGTDDIRPPKVV